MVQYELASILFLYAVLHPDVGYRQGSGPGASERARWYRTVRYADHSGVQPRTEGLAKER